MNDLIAYLVAAMLLWSPTKDHRPDSPEQTTARYESIAETIAHVTLDPTETPLFRGMNGRERGAVQLAAIAFFESKFWSYVDDGLCNDHAWRHLHARRGTPGEPICDGGLAVSLWQVHTRFGLDNHLDGILLEGQGWRHGVGGFIESDLLSNRELAARVALHSVRQSMGRTGSLCGYTGESEMSGCPKAKARRALADAYWRGRPFQAEGP